MRCSVLTITSLFISAAAMSQEFNNKLLMDTAMTKQPGLTMTVLSTFPRKNEQTVPQNYYAQHLAFFCRQELKMQQVHVPVVFRLGSMDYCNWLEQKPGYSYITTK